MGVTTNVVQFLKRKAPPWVWIAGLVLMAGTLYGPFLNAPFSMDDYNLLLDDIHLKNPGRWMDYFYPSSETAVGADDGPQHSSYYRPLAHALPFVIHRLVGPRPWVFRLVNLLVFTAGCVGFVFLLKRLGLNEWAAFTAAAMMVLHPHNTIAVNYIPGAFSWLWLFSVIMLLGLLRPRIGPVQGVWILGSGLAALLCHEAALALLPVGVILLLWAGRRRWAVRYALITIAVLLIYKMIKPYRDQIITTWLQWMMHHPWEYVKGFASLLLLHGRWLILGRDVVLMGWVPFTETASGMTTVVVLAVMLGGVLACVWALRRRTIWGWFLLWYGAGFSIVALGMLSYPDKGWVVESHWLFPAAAAYAALCGWAVDALKQKRFLTGYVLSVLVLLFYGVQAQQINRLWSREPLYLAYWHRLQPRHALVMFFFGDYYMAHNDPDRAMTWYEKGLAVKPHDVAAINNLALCALQKKDLDRAQNLLEDIVRRSPTSGALNNLAVFYFKELGRVDQALALWEKAAAMDPHGLFVRYNLARTLLDQGRPEEALTWLHQNLSVAPEDVTTRILLLEAQLKTKHPQAPGTAAWLVSRLRSPEELVRLGVLCDEAELGEWARRFFEKALQEDPSYWKAYDALGVWLANRGRFDAAETIWSMGVRHTTAVSHFEELLQRLDRLRSQSKNEATSAMP